jgi:hypothetical protein
MKPNLGKLLPVGHVFVTTTKRMDKFRHGQCKLNAQSNGPLITYEVLRPGNVKIFTKGKRQYVCEVIRLVEIKTGVSIGSLAVTTYKGGNRYWQFSYLVKIIEN